MSVVFNSFDYQLAFTSWFKVLHVLSCFLLVSFSLSFRKTRWQFLCFAIWTATFNNEDRSAIYSATCVSELKRNKVCCEDSDWWDREWREGDRKWREGERYEKDREWCEGDRERCKGDCKGLLFDSSAWFGKEAFNVSLLYRLGKLSSVNSLVFFGSRVRFSLSEREISSIIISEISIGGFLFLVLEVAVKYNIL